MNIKIFIRTFSLCIITLIVSELSTSSMLTTTEQTIESSSPESEKSVTLLQKIKQFFGKLFYQQKEIEKTENSLIATPTQKVIISIEQTTPMISRVDALEQIRQISTKVFDPNDVEHISVHLIHLNNLTIHLDPLIDKKTITAIHFLLENQHRSSYLDTVFWIQNTKKLELDTSIPVTKQVFDMPKTEKLKILAAKLRMPIEPAAPTIK